jgi:hypothetical protein
MQANEPSLVATTDSFNQAMQELQRAKKDKDKIPKFNPLDERHDWVEAVEVLQLAEKTY